MQHWAQLDEETRRDDRDRSGKLLGLQLGKPRCRDVVGLVRLIAATNDPWWLEHDKRSADVQALSARQDAMCW